MSIISREKIFSSLDVYTYARIYMYACVRIAYMYTYTCAARCSTKRSIVSRTMKIDAFAVTGDGVGRAEFVRGLN